MPPSNSFILTSIVTYLLADLGLGLGLGQHKVADNKLPKLLGELWRE